MRPHGVRDNASASRCSLRAQPRQKDCFGHRRVDTAQPTLFSKRGPRAPAGRGRRYVHTTSETLTWALRQVPSQVHATKMPDDSTPPHHTCFFVNLPHPHTHTPGSVSNLRGRGVRWPHHIPHTTPPPLCPVCFHHAASLAPSSSSHSRSRRTVLKRASPALEHLEKTDHQTALSPVRDSRRGSVSCSSAWDPVLID